LGTYLDPIFGLKTSAERTPGWSAAMQWPAATAVALFRRGAERACEAGAREGRRVELEQRAGDGTIGGLARRTASSNRRRSARASHAMGARLRSGKG
jgi:hypothetical protein